MKVTPKQYALGLYELIEEADASNIDDILKNFVVFLSKSNDLRIADKVICEFENIWNDKKGIAEVEAISVDKLDEEIITMLKKYATQWLNKKEINIKQKMDKDILGGIVLKHKDTIIDGSVKKKIDLLGNKLSRT